MLYLISFYTYICFCVVLVTACCYEVLVFIIVFRQYVLPRSSYTTSDGCSDNSSCPSYPLAGHKYSVSSGYESMTLNSAEGVTQDPPETTENDDSGGSQAKSQSTDGLYKYSPHFKRFTDFSYQKNSTKNVNVVPLEAAKVNGSFY